MSTSEDKHPFIGEFARSGVRNRGLWNTNADFPVRHLLTPPEEFSDPEPPVVLEVPVDIPVLQTRHEGQQVVPPHAQPPQHPVSDAEPLSEYTQWLTRLNPPSVKGVIPPADDLTPAPLPLIRQNVVDTDPEKPKSRKKKKKGKKKKHKGGLTAKQRLKARLEALDVGIITDTLAELTAKQGYIREAIGMYRKLVTLHPERAAAYLAQIRKLKNDEESE